MLPNANQNGTTTIDLVVSDGDLTAATSFVLTVNPVNDAPTGTVEISGDPIVGQTLSASNVIGDIDGFDEIEYQWTRDGVEIPGATGSTYELTNENFGSDIRVVASYVDGGGTTESLTSNTISVLSAPTPVIEDNDAPTENNNDENNSAEDNSEENSSDENDILSLIHI